MGAYAAHANNDSSSRIRTTLEKLADFVVFAICALRDVLAQQPHPPGNVTQPRADLGQPIRVVANRIPPIADFRLWIDYLPAICKLQCFVSACLLQSLNSVVKANHP